METVVSGQLSVVSWKKSRSLGPLVMTIPKLSFPPYRQKKAVERGTQILGEARREQKQVLRLRAHPPAKGARAKNLGERFAQDDKSKECRIHVRTDSIGVRGDAEG